MKVDSWIRTNAEFFTAMAAQIMTNTLIRVFVGLTVALGIASVLVVSVIQKSKEIGILRAMGTSREQVLRVFLIQGGFMGLAGALLGSPARVGIPAAVARRRAQRRRHADVHHRDAAVAVRDRLRGRDARRPARRGGARAARGAARSGRGDP